MPNYIDEHRERILVGKSLDYFAIGTGAVIAGVGVACIGDIIGDIAQGNTNYFREVVDVVVAAVNCYVGSLLIHKSQQRICQASHLEAVLGRKLTGQEYGRLWR